MTQRNNRGNRSISFPNPMAKESEKTQESYGISYASAIDTQWGISSASKDSLFDSRFGEFENNRAYANGTQNTDKYMKLITNQDPHGKDGTYMNLDWKPVPIVPKYVRVVAEKILSRKPYPSIEALDPVSKTERDKKMAKMEAAINNRDMIAEAASMGLQVPMNPSSIPESTEEAEIFQGHNLKTNAEIAGQLALSLTLDWSDYSETVYRRNVYDEVVLGMGVSKRDNDPNYGIVQRYVDPALFVHSYTEDPSMGDITYAGHVERISISELKRRAGDKFSEKQYEEMAKYVMSRNGNDSSIFSRHKKDTYGNVILYGYDSYLIDVLQFEFISTDTIYYEEKENRFGNKGFYKKGEDYKAPENSVFERKPYKMYLENIYGGSYILGCEKIFGYGKKTNMPRNIHDISRTKMSYSVSCTNIRNMIPKSLVSSITGFADQMQITHLKLQQAIAKAKPDGLIIDIEGLENVDLGQGEMSPLALQDVYEQTGTYYFRSKDVEGRDMRPPISPINNTINNVQILIGVYNHYLNMVRDATGINEVVDGSTPKGEALVGVRQQAISASNNALYDITNSCLLLFRRTCEDMIKCIQILPSDSVLFKVYEKAIGKRSMEVISSFRELPMYNFGIRVSQEMSDEDRIFVEQNIQAMITGGVLGVDDAMAIRQVRDIDQMQRLLSVRITRRREKMEEERQRSIYAAADADAQKAERAAMAAVQKEAAITDFKIKEIEAKAMAEVMVKRLIHPYTLREIQEKNIGTLGFKETEQNFKEKIETYKEEKKDDRLDKQTAHQAELIEQRKTGEKPVINKKEKEDNIVEKIMGNE